MGYVIIGIICTGVLCAIVIFCCQTSSESLENKSQSKSLEETVDYRNIVQDGDRVTVRIIVKELVIILKNESEEDIGGDIQRVSTSSPIGQAIWQKHLWDEVKYKTPTGNKMLEIVKIEKKGTFSEIIKGEDENGNW